MDIKHPEVTVRLTGHDGNAFAIMGDVVVALRRAGVPEQDVSEYTTEATSGDYNHLLQTTMRWVETS